jgi:hypothetical protein
MRNTFTNEEYANMHFVYGLCSRNGRDAVVEYRQRYPHGRMSHRKTFETVHRILRATVSLPRANAERKQRCGEGDVAAVQGGQSTSVRTIYRTTGVAQTGMKNLPFTG